MSARARLHRARWLLASGVVARAVLWGAAVCVLALSLVALGDLSVGLSMEVRRAGRLTALAGAALVAAALLWRDRRARSASAVALWLEERLPVLRYGLVTLLEPGHELAGARAADLEARVARVSWRRTLSAAIARAVAVPLATAIAAILLLLALPPGVLARVRHPRPGDLLDRAAAARRGPVNHLDPLIAVVRPPAYSGERSLTIEQPASVPALVGSAIVLEGRGRDAPVLARIGEQTVPAAPAGERWRIALDMPSHPAAVILRDGPFERLVALEPRPDSAPLVTLTVPARDTVFRLPSGRLPLAAAMRDDIGLADGWFEYIVSSGEGESFAFRSGVVGRTVLAGRRSADVPATLSLDSLGLAAGDVVHVRAVARDGNAVGGPTSGVSETRTLRVARRGEYDSVAVEGAPPPQNDRSEISQRMLIVMAEELVGRSPRLSRRAFVDESRSIGLEQGRLRRRVGEIIFMRLGETAGEHSHDEGDTEDRPLTPEELLRRAEEATGHAANEMLDFAGGESPVVAINRPLLEAYNAMWEAGRELQIGEPRRALPHMRAALAAIQRARAAERYYLRGRPPAVVVDVQKVRLAGRQDAVAASARQPRRADDQAAVVRGRRFAVAVQLLPDRPTAAIDSLMLLRLDALASSPALAAALAEAIDALRTGRDATAALGRARRAVAGEPVVTDSLPRWGGAW